MLSFQIEQLLVTLIPVAACLYFSQEQVAVVCLDPSKSKYRRILRIDTLRLNADPISWKVSLGTIQTRSENVPPNPQGDGLGYNPRCIKRDFNKQAVNKTNDPNTRKLIRNNIDIANFQDNMQTFLPGVMGGAY